MRPAKFGHTAIQILFLATSASSKGVALPTAHGKDHIQIPSKEE